MPPAGGASGSGLGEVSPIGARLAQIELEPEREFQQESPSDSLAGDFSVYLTPTPASSAYEWPLGAGEVPWWTPGGNVQRIEHGVGSDNFGKASQNCSADRGDGLFNRWAQDLVSSAQRILCCTCCY